MFSGALPAYRALLVITREIPAPPGAAAHASGRFRDTHAIEPRSHIWREGPERAQGTALLRIARPRKVRSRRRSENVPD